MAMPGEIEDTEKTDSNLEAFKKKERIFYPKLSSVAVGHEVPTNSMCAFLDFFLAADFFSGLYAFY